MKGGAGLDLGPQDRYFVAIPLGPQELERKLQEQGGTRCSPSGKLTLRSSE
jgi:hypothetical protein